MKLETIKKDKRKKIIIGSMIVLSVVGCLTVTITRAKYKNVQSLKLANGTVDYKAPDLKLAIKVSEDGVNYTSQKDIPIGDYTFNTEKSKCRIPTTTLNGENAPVDESVTIEYVDGKLNFLGLTRNDTKCYVYFYKTPDTEVPTISNVATTVTKTEINVTVTASDNKGVTEYWYQLDSGDSVKETTNSHTFTGLTAGQTYTLKVWVKDAAGNPSEVTTKSVTTKPDGQTSSAIIADIEKSSYFKNGTPTFSNIATNDEGVYKVADGMYGGHSYYWRGAATTNHVIFDSKCWRIVRINGDKSIRLIYNGTLSGNKCTQGTNSNAVIMGSSDTEKYYSTWNGAHANSSYVGWTYTLGEQRTTSGTASNAKTQTEKWYNNSLSASAKTKVDPVGKFCNDRNTGQPYSNWNGWSTSWSATETLFGYAGVDRLWNKYTPTLSCPSGDIYQLSVGAITADEVAYAGGKNEGNSYFYLNAGVGYWTMSPFNWNGRYAGVFYVRSDGYLDGIYVQHTNLGLRPVINLRSDVTFNAGSNGTYNNPYIVQ